MNELTLARYGIEPSIVIPETHFFTLAIENKTLLLTILSELRQQTEDGKEAGFTLLLNGKPMSMEKSVSVVFDSTDIDFNAKKITNLLAKNFSEFLGLGEQAEALTKLEKIIFNLAEDFRVKSGLNIEYDTVMNGNNLAKVCSLRMADDKQRLCERLCEYVNLLCDLKPLKLFVLVFGKQFLEESDIFAFYRYCFDKNVRLLFIEGRDVSEYLQGERRLIIDSDLCSIPIGYDGLELTKG
ncbi:type II-A CRISPR-associated protein Csn2 [Lachnospiraceae bacterium ZAX-1]